MSRKVAALLPSTDQRLRELGDRLRLARLRRRLSAKQVAARAGMAPMTLRSLERGGSGVTIGAYAAVMQVLGVETDLDLLVQADPTGRALQDVRLSSPRRSATRRIAESHAVAAPPRADRTARPPRQTTQPPASLRARAAESAFVDARDLAALLQTVPAAPRRTRRR